MFYGQHRCLAVGQNGICNGWGLIYDAGPGGFAFVKNHDDSSKNCRRCGGDRFAGDRVDGDVAGDSARFSSGVHVCFRECRDVIEWESDFDCDDESEFGGNLLLRRGCRI
jgi:hypothetical protein